MIGNFFSNGWKSFFQWVEKSGRAESLRVDKGEGAAILAA
jgi:hypothetical protein